jgi:hypothetical protein
MYFVTTNKAGYVLFCMTPSERAAIGLTDKQLVQLLVRDPATREFSVLHEWMASEFSPTDFLSALHHADEPADPRLLLQILPASLRP